MIRLPDEFDSIFRYIVVVSQRAEQLINGAKPRTESRHSKPTLVAKTDVDRGEVNWRVLTQAELDARRQEIVDQLRAEVAGAEGEGEVQLPIPDVLPTAAAAVNDGLPDSSERDDELARLQRLLGMAAGDGDSEEDAEDADDSADDEVEATEVDLSEVEAIEKQLEDDEDEED